MEGKKVKQEGVRDPIHNWIKFSENEKKIINSPYVQRLRWISQLTSVDHVFPGGTHNRFTHSLGTMYLAGKYMKNLFNNTPITESMHQNVQCIWNNKSKFIQLARIAALLHDVGHGPFSHAYDRTVYKKIYGKEDGGHDEYRLKLIFSPLLAPYIENCGIDPNDLVKCWTKNRGNDIYSVIGCIIQGPLGADRMDFTLRDSYFTGTNHFGTISNKRIISNSSMLVFGGENIKEPHIRLIYKAKIMPDIIQALEGRFHMYDSVYLHKVVISSSILIEKMIEEAYIPLKLEERTRDPYLFLNITDYTIIGEITSSTSSELEKAREYCRRYMFRELPTMIREELSQERTKEILNENMFVSHSKNIESINTETFDKLGIMFYSSERGGTIESCSQVLEKMKYSPPQQSYHYVRTFIIN
jgi:uncharacterized protein